MSFDKWLEKMSYLTNTGMTPEQRQTYELQQKAEQSKQECLKCEEYKNWMLTYSPSVRFMIEQVARVGGNINKQNIICDSCDELKSGGFHPELGILLCWNRIYSKWHLEDTLTHELVHAYDHCKFNVKWDNLKHHACSEIRASSLSGECRMMNQIVKNKIFTFVKGHEKCVKRRAVLSVMNNPECKDKAEAEKVVNQVFESCFHDTRPFEEIYR